MGRKPLGEEKLRNVGLTLTDAEIATVDALAASRQINRGEMLRLMVRRVLISFGDIEKTVAKNAAEPVTVGQVEACQHPKVTTTGYGMRICDACKAVLPKAARL